MSFAIKGESALRRVLEDARAELRCSREALTVLQVDPYRLDTPANHRDGAWVAEQLDRAIGPHRRIHWRGLHYAIVARGDVIKPNGETYLNTDDDWHWLSDNARKAARWLSDRVATAKSDWEAEAQETLDEQIDSDALDVIRERAAEKLEEIRTEVERINDQLRMAVDGIVELPEAIVPEPEVADEKLCRQAPQISSSWSWVRATRALIVRKAYGGAG